MTWPSVDAPASAPSDHGEVRTQAYYAGGGDYFKSGQYAQGAFSVGALGTSAMTAGQCRYRPFWLPVRRAFDRIGLDVAVAATGGSGGLLRLGLYSDLGGQPDSLIVDAGTVSSESSGTKEVVISESLNPRLYWIAVACQVAGCTIRLFPTNTVTPFVPLGTTPGTAVSGSAYLQTGVTGALPGTATPGSPGINFPAVYLRAT